LHEPPEARSASVIATGDTEVELWVMDKATFQEAMDTQLRDYLKARISLQDSKVEMQDLDFVKVIGKGGFGVVKMVEHRKSGARFALKAVQKRGIVEHGEQESLSRERSILAEVDHPFIVKFVRSYKLSSYVYFLQEIISGGELLDVLDKLGLLTHEQANFYTGCIVLALEFLHARRIAYLDLKAENLLVDHQGYLKLIDFGIAQRITSARVHGAKGTPTYMAPEMVRSKGYNTAADLWSLGVNLYEFVVGYVPFGHDCKTIGEIAKEVAYAKLQFPPWFIPSQVPFAKETRELIEGLLIREPSQRLGASFSGFNSLKNHAFFKGFSWDDLQGRHKRLQPPYIPEAESYAEDNESSGPPPTPVPLEPLELRENAALLLEWTDPAPGWEEEF